MEQKKQALSNGIRTLKLLDSKARHGKIKSVGLKNQTTLNKVNSELQVPLELWHMLNREFNFSLDVAATNENKRCSRWFTKSDDALKQEWTCADGESIWCHPPLGHQLPLFVKKARETGKKHRVVCLLPSKTHSIWWHNYIERQAEVRFLKGKMVFANNKKANSASWCLVIFERK